MNRVSPSELALHSEAETMNFCRAEQDIQLQSGESGHPFSDARLHSRISNCGIASAVVQAGLRENHAIDTKLHASRSMPDIIARSGNHFKHALLRHNDSLVDPTYGQLYEFVGVKTPLLRDIGDAAYPDSLALIVDLNNPEQTIDPLVEDLDRAKHLPTEAIFAPWRELTKRRIGELVRTIYDIESYGASFEVETFHRSFDRIEAIKATARNQRTQP